MTLGAPALLVVAGEESGDRFAASVVARLRVNAFGLGGPALSGLGLDGALLEPRSHLADYAVMGARDALSRALGLVRLQRKLLEGARQRSPRAALLVGFSEFNARLGRRLRQQGIRVYWLAPPQVWAWRPGRAQRLARSADVLGLLFPFERAHWEPFHPAARVVGHPALEYAFLSRSAARAALAMSPDARAVLLLPGSRVGEVKRLAAAFMEAGEALRRGGYTVHLAIATALPESQRSELERAARARGLAAATVRPEAYSAFDAAIACSGTATLECALAGVPPVIAYRTDALTFLLARGLVRVPHIGLPNLLLGRRVFPEFVQNVTATHLVRAAERCVAEQQAGATACSAVRRALTPRDEAMPSVEVARDIAAWLA
jgi:lipid-A-disaccharide synthase